MFNNDKKSNIPTNTSIIKIKDIQTARTTKRQIILVLVLCANLFLISPSSANTIDYKELREDPLETALRNITSTGETNWDSEEILSGETPALVNKMSWPIKTGKLVGNFNRNRKKGHRRHHGLDLVAPQNTPIHAVLPGTVEIVSGGGKGFRGYGKVLIIQHANNLWTLYSHCNIIKVKVGQKVEKNQVVATVGRTGRATTNHLHFEVRKQFGYPLDPLKHLPKDSTYINLVSK
ncbi:MAG: M23 family metallopeptidase [Synergistaceae bacterium]